MTYIATERLTEKVFEITTGLLLGDGNLQKPKGCRYFRFRFGQTNLRQDYVYHLFEIYQTGLKKTSLDNLDIIQHEKPLINRNKPRLYNYTTLKNKLNHFSLNFETRVSSAFDYHAQIFYSNKSSKKNLCLNLNDFYDILTPTALAYWYMDDGSWPNKGSKSFMLCTHGYTIEQAWFFSNLLNKKFGLMTTVQFNRKQPIIRISAKSYKLFKDLIYPTLDQMPSMQTKFPFPP